MHLKIFFRQVSIKFLTCILRILAFVLQEVIGLFQATINIDV